ncbi:MAG: GGDEF domain-containing protein [Oscillospiraceae bacterium]|nr:GGDEF domain-containing protein [Oscillospiraceae bacterium]
MERLPLSERIDQILVKYKNDPFGRERELKKLLKEAEKEANLYSIGKINMLLANCVLGQGKRGSSVGYAYKAVGIFENTDERALLARSYNLLGIAYAGQGNFQRAITAYNKGIQVIRGDNYPGIRKDTLLNNIGDAYYQMGAYRKSLRIAKDCFSSCRKIVPVNYARIIVFGMNVSDSYCGLGEFQKAKQILDEIRGDVEHNPGNIYVSEYFTRLTYVLYATGNIEEGVKNADRMLELVHSNYDSYDNHYFFEEITSFMIELGDFRRAQYIADALTKYSDENGYMLDRIISKRVQAKICYAAGDLERALSLYKELSTLYEEWLRLQKAIKNESQKSIETATKEITKLMKKVRDSEEKAVLDSLTGLMNRAALEKVSAEFYQNAREYGKKLGGIFLDIDHFKEYNDTYGHAAGDLAIKFIAGACLEEESMTVRFFRYGGDEFFAIVLGHQDEELEALALRIAEKIRSSGFEHIKNPNRQRLTVSVGVANVDLKTAEYTIRDIIKFADKALFHAKDRGKDDVFVYRAPAHSEYEYRRVSADDFE